MAITYYGSRISDHMTRTPEGYLICRDVPINRIGDQEYFAQDLQLDGDPNRVVTVHRYPEDVFEGAALASFEGKDITRGHPPDNLTPENQASYSKGHIQNVRRVGEYTVADLFIKDPGLASDVENGVVREVSCGYLCDYEPDGNGYRQTRIRGNHVAVVPKGRAGHDVAIKDEAKGGQKGMSKLTRGILAAFGMAAKDAKPDEMGELIDTTADALEAVPAQKAQEATPAKEKAEDVMVERAPKGDDLGSKLDKVIEMLASLEKKNDREEKKLRDEDDIDEMIEKLAGKVEDPEKAMVVEEMAEGDCMQGGMAKDAALQILKRVRPAVCGISDKTQRARVVDALMASISSPGVMGDIQRASQSSAMRAADSARKTSYEKMCEESQSAYYARNPHKTQKEGM